MESTDVNSFFYRYLQMAYEFINKNAPDSIQGSPEYFRLVRDRMDSVIDGTEPKEDHGDKLDFDGIHKWLNENQKHNSERIINGSLGDFKFNKKVVHEEIRKRVEENLSKKEYRPQKDNRLPKLGLDSYATYLPLHFFFDGDLISKKWGIYISEDGIFQIAAFLYQETKNWTRHAKDEWFSVGLVEIAFEILLRHEFEHFKFESFALNAELICGRPIYAPYVMKVYANSYPSYECLEEAAANSTVLYSRHINSLFKNLFPGIERADWAGMLQKELFSTQPDCYQNTDFLSGWPLNSDPFQDEMVSYVNGRKKVLDPRRLAMNYLCNQIISSSIDGLHSTGTNFRRDIPFFAFTPDNYYLRAENLVPIHLVQSLNPDDCMIGFSLPKENDVIEFITQFGFDFDRKNKHETWQSPLFPQNNLTIRFYNGTLGFDAYKSLLKTFCLTPMDFSKYRQMNKKGKEQFVLNLREKFQKLAS